MRNQKQFTKAATCKLRDDKNTEADDDGLQYDQIIMLASQPWCYQGKVQKKKIYQNYFGQIPTHPPVKVSWFY